MLATATCDKTSPWPERMRWWHAELTGQVATTRTITITRPHLTTDSLPCTSLCPPGSATRLLRQLHAGPHRDCVVSSLPTTLPESCFAGQSAEKRPAVFGSGLH